MYRDEDTIFDIIHAARLVVQFKAEMTHEEFLQDSKTQSAMLYQITLIG